LLFTVVFIFALNYLKILLYKRLLRLRIENNEKLQELHIFLNFLLIVSFYAFGILFICWFWNINLINVLDYVYASKCLWILLNCTIIFCCMRAIWLAIDVACRMFIIHSELIQEEVYIKRFVTLIAITKIFLKSLTVVVVAVIAPALFNINITLILTQFGFLVAGATFALQSLIKDLVIGMIMLFEDAFRVGDTVEVAGVFGEVEEITLRVLKIRNNNNGSLVFIPFNKIDTVSNRTRKHTYVVIPIYVDGMSDAEETMRLLVLAGSELKTSSELKKRIFLSDVSVVGPISVGLNYMMFEARVKILPIGSIKPILGAYYTICRRIGVKFADEPYLLSKTS
jgi:small conductance mechanosensitive channel